LLRKFEALAVNIIDEGYKVDPDKTRSIVVRQLDVWKSYTCADLAISSQRLNFVAHPTVQSLFDELWNGPLAHTVNIIQFLFVLVCPFYLMALAYRRDMTLKRLYRGLGDIILLQDWSLRNLLFGKCTTKEDNLDEDKIQYNDKATRGTSNSVRRKSISVRRKSIAAHRKSSTTKEQINERFSFFCVLVLGSLCCSIFTSEKHIFYRLGHLVICDHIVSPSLF